MLYVLKKSDPDKYVGQNLRASEVACKCGTKICEDILIDSKTIRSWNEVRNGMGRSLWVNSFHRCQYWNLKQKGTYSSRHLYGLAIDISTKDLNDEEKKRLFNLCSAAFDVALVYPTFYHCHNNPASI